MKKKRIIPVAEMVKIIFLLFLLISAVSRSKAQTPADTIRKEMTAINQVYDSAFFLTFDIKMTYTSDTLWAGTDTADFENSVMDGTYTFHRKKALYKLGGIEFMQNDSFTIAVYNDNKFILVGKPVATQKPGFFIPTRVILDSMMAQLESLYTVDFSSSDTINRIRFVANDTNAVYQQVIIEYDPATHYLSKIRYNMKDYGYDPFYQVSNVVRKARMTFEFKSYRVEQVSGTVFDEAKYLFWDGPGVMKPADAYKDYTIYKNY